MPKTITTIVTIRHVGRIGAVHSIVFGGYSADSLATRILDAGARVLVTADGVFRGSKLIALLQIAHTAMETAAKQGGEVLHHICVSHLPRSE